MNAVLLLAYRRWQNVDLILDVCRLAGITLVFIHVDGGTTADEKKDVERTIESAAAYKQRWGIDIRIVAQSENIGCAVSMILSLDAVFSTEGQVTVLEDDCIPTLDFFRFMNESFHEMRRNPKIGMACGAQFAPSRITEDKWLLSRYPFNWGWGITKSQWELLSSKMVKKDRLKPRDKKITLEETTYWNAGSRRALDGYTDVWDTLLVREMLRHDSYSILPGANLVCNVGNDAHALHTHGAQIWTNFPTGNFHGENSSLEFNSSFDQWARSRFYKISHRHLFSTRFTWLIDVFFKKPKRRSLQERVQSATVNFDE